MRSKRTLQVSAISLVALFFVLIRLHGLDASCLWFDEIFSVHAADQPWTSILSFVSRDLIHPPLFYIFLKVWTNIGGDSLLWLRLLPVVFACLAVVPFLLLTKELKLEFYPRLIAIILFTVNGSLIKYAQEVRMYSMLMFVGLTSLWLFTRYFQKGKNLVPLLIVNILLVYTHYFGWLVVSGEVLAILLFQRIKIRAILLMIGSVFVSFLPWAFSVWQSVAAGSAVSENIGWIQRPGLLQILQLAFNLVDPFYYQVSNAEPMTVLKVSAPLVVLVAVVINAGLIYRKQTANDGSTSIKLLLVLAAFPVAAAFVVSWLFPYSVWGTRHLIVVFPLFAILVGIFAGRTQIRFLAPAFLTLLILFSGYGLILDLKRETPDHIWCAWEPLAAEASTRKAEKVYVFEDLIAYHLWWAEQGKDRTPMTVVKVQNVDGIREDKAYFLPRGFSGIQLIDGLDLSEPKVWLAYRAAAVDDAKPPLVGFIRAGYRITDRKVIAADTENAILVSLEK